MKEKKFNLVFIMETKIKTKKSEFIKRRIGFKGYFTVDSIGKSGGLVMLWNSELKVEVHNYSRRHINVWINEKSSNHKWLLTGFYGQPDSSKRQES